MSKFNEAIPRIDNLHLLLLGFSSNLPISTAAASSRKKKIPEEAIRNPFVLCQSHSPVTIYHSKKGGCLNSAFIQKSEEVKQEPIPIPIPIMYSLTP